MNTRGALKTAETEELIEVTPFNEEDVRGCFTKNCVPALQETLKNKES